MKVASVDVRTGRPERLNQGAFIVDGDSQRLACKNRPDLELVREPLNRLNDHDVRCEAFVLKQCVNNGKGGAVPAEDMKCEHLEVCRWNTPKSPIDTNAFGARKKPNAPLSSHDDDALVVADKD